MGAGDRGSFHVFLSHSSEEQSVAAILQEYLETVFGQTLRVFRSSDDGSIGTGKDQYPEILRALGECQVYVVLLSKYSAKRPWVNFEAGYGKARGVALFTVLIRNTSASDVPTPLSELLVRPLAQLSVIEEIVTAIEKATAITAASRNPDWLLGRLRTAESAMPDRELRLRPFRFEIPPSNRQLGFELIFNGPRPIKLVRVWAEVPRALSSDTGWAPSEVLGHMAARLAERPDGRQCWRLEQTASVYPPDRRYFEPLHPSVLPNEDPKVLRELRFALNPTLGAGDDDEILTCQVVAEDGASPVLSFRFGDVEFRPAFKM